MVLPDLLQVRAMDGVASDKMGWEIALSSPFLILILFRSDLTNHLIHDCIQFFKIIFNPE